MVKNVLLIGWLLLLVGLNGCRSEETTAQIEPTLVLEPCQLAGGVAAECGTLTVPENRAAVDGRTLGLNIAVIPAQSRDAAADPLFMLAGGPGQAAVSVYPPIVSLLDNLNETRDVVLVDQRGTGESAPLTCDNLEEETVGESPTDEEVVTLIQACAAELSATADLTQYTTESSVADLDAVREALGYEQINLYGASYGTRAALAYARRHPERVRTMVLDAVAGPDLVLFAQMPRDGQRALELLFARCAADAACSENFPNLAAEYEALLAQLEEPQTVTVTEPLSGERLEVLVTRDRLAQYVFNILYSTDLVSLLPLLIHTAHETGNLEPLVTQAFVVGQGAGLNLGLLYAVTCSEDAPLIDLDEAQALQAETDFALQADDFLAICEAFPQAALPADFREPVVAEIPTLLLSGDADPVTPPSYAAAVAETLPNSLHLVAPNYGHTILAVGCVPRLITSFIEAGSVAGLDTECLDALEPPPFFVTFAGPEP